MQSEYCCDATCKAAFEYEYEVIVPKDTTTTFDNGDFTAKKLTEFYEDKIWNNRFAKVMSVEQIIKNMV